MILTIPMLPDSLLAELEKRAKVEGRPVSEIALEALTRGLGEEAPGNRSVRRDLSQVAGTMSDEDARAIEETVHWMDEADLAANS
jgi:hypothetical protein